MRLETRDWDGEIERLRDGEIGSFGISNSRDRTVCAIAIDDAPSAIHYSSIGIGSVKRISI